MYREKTIYESKNSVWVQLPLAEDRDNTFEKDTDLLHKMRYKNTDNDCYTPLGYKLLSYRFNFVGTRNFFFFLSNIKSYRDKVLKHYDLLDYNTKTEPRGSKIS